MATHYTSEDYLRAAEALEAGQSEGIGPVLAKERCRLARELRTAARIPLHIQNQRLLNAVRWLYGLEGGGPLCK